MQSRSSAKGTGKHGIQPLLLMVRTQARNDEGWSLASTLVMMLVISIFLGAMWTALLPIYSQVAGMRYRDVARAVDEAAVDNLVGKLNDPTAGYTPPQSYGSSLTMTATQTQGKANFTVNTTIKNLGSLPPLNCVLYSANRPAADQFYSITSTVTQGLLTKQLTVLMSPIGSAPFNPFIYGPAFGVTTVNEVGLAGINGYNLPAGWKNPYQFADTTVAQGVTWQIGNGDLTRSQVIAGSQFEYWHPGNQPQAPSGTIPLTYEPFTQIMGNVYSNFTDQSGANGNGYWMRNQLSDISGGANTPNGDPNNANVFGAANGMTLNGVGVPTGFESGNTNNSIPIPPFNGTPPANGSGSNLNSSWGFNAQPGTTAGNMPMPGTANGGSAFQGNPYTGGYITSPGPGQAGAIDNWLFPQPPTPQAPGAPVGVPQPATGGLGVPNNTGTYFASAPPAVVVDGGTINITPGATMPPSSLSVGKGQSIDIPPGNYSVQSLQVVNGGAINIDPSVKGQSQFFVNPPGGGSITPGQGTNAAVYVDNTSSINTTGISSGTGFNSGGTKSFGANYPGGTPAVDTVNTINESSGSCLNLTINTNAQCNMLFAGQTRALVNAPSANVNVGYQPNPRNQNNYTPNSYTDPTKVMKKDANFYGAIVAGNVSVVSDYSSGAGAYLHYDIKLKQIDSAPGQPVTFNKPLTWYDPWTFKVLPQAPGAIQQWRAVSWQE